MISSIRLTNFRKFESYTISCRSGNVLVGPNNAGKSALIEALRILDGCIRFCRKRTPSQIQMDGGDVLYGYHVPESAIDVDLAHSSHNYIDERSVLEFKVSNGNKVIVSIRNGEQIRFVIDANGTRLNSVGKFQSALSIDLTVVPTIGPIEREEQWVQDETIRKSQHRKTSSRHFRNVWLRKSDEEFETFANDVSAAWPGIEIKKTERQRGDPAVLVMFYSENRQDRELRWSGFGFQIWLQIMTHLHRASTQSIVVIDEPDIYLHPDIQKKLMQILRDRFQQFFVATHSAEIINSSDEMEVASINSKYRNAMRIKSEEDYNRVFSYIGSSTNTDFARVAKTRKVIFVEGEDKTIIQLLGRRLDFEHLSATVIPFVKLGGFSGWEKALGAVWAFREILSIDIEVYCLFDRDYRCDEEIHSFLSKMNGDSVVCRVLDRKEIENFLIDLSTLQRAVRKRAKDREAGEITEQFVIDLLSEVTSRYKSKVWAQRSARAVEYFHSVGDKRDAATITELLHIQFEDEWADLPSRVKLVPGKRVLSDINEKLQSQGIGGLSKKMLVDSSQIASTDFLNILSDINKFCILE
jgi:predicted ATP-dependent endonuclease of OLD family